MHTYIHIYIHTYIHTYTHTHTHTKIKDAVDHTTLDSHAIRIKFAESARLVKALSSMHEEHADEVMINSSKYKVAARDTAAGKYAPVDGDQGPGQARRLNGQ